MDENAYVRAFLFKVHLPFNVLVVRAFLLWFFVGMRGYVVVAVIQDQEKLVWNFLFDFDSLVVSDKVKCGFLQ